MIPPSEMVEKVARDEPIHWISRSGAGNVTACGEEQVFPMRGNGWRVRDITCPDCDRAICDIVHAAMKGDTRAAIEAMPLNVLREALVAARQAIQSERDCLVECATLGPAHDISTLDPQTKPAVDELDTVLAKIDAALERVGLSGQSR